MATEAPYRNMDAVELRLRLLQQRRDLHGFRVEQHIEVLKDREQRGALLKNGVQDLVHSFRPAEMLRKAIAPAAVGIAPMLLQFLGMRGGFKKRLLWTALSFAVPALLKRVDVSKLLSGLGHSDPSDHVGNGQVHAGTYEDR